eukprot:scaffold60197_cov35-Phaeocystis_antarctica.AAC.1
MANCLTISCRLASWRLASCLCEGVAAWPHDTSRSMAKRRSMLASQPRGREQPRGATREQPASPARSRRELWRAVLVSSSRHLACRLGRSVTPVKAPRQPSATEARRATPSAMGKKNFYAVKCGNDGERRRVRVDA